MPTSVVFVTHNRKDLLCKAIKAAYAQTVPVDVLVMDDASEDGTDQLIASHFPDVRYYRSSTSMGPSYQRNEGAKKASSDIVFFLDDDTVLQSEKTIERILHDFTSPEIGAIALPFINILQSNDVCTAAPDTNVAYVYHAFVAAAFAIRRHVFLKLGGFRSEYFYMGEEGDFCIRLLNAGYYIKAGTSQPAHHFQPPHRISFKADFYGRRNDILFSYLNVPRRYFPVNLIGSMLKGLWFGIKVRRLGNMLKGVVSGLRLLSDKDIAAMVKPVSRKTYLQYRYLKHHEPLQLDQLNEKPAATASVLTFKRALK